MGLVRQLLVILTCTNTPNNTAMDSWAFIAEKSKLIWTNSCPWMLIAASFATATTRHNPNLPQWVKCHTTAVRPSMEPRQQRISGDVHSKLREGAAAKGAACEGSSGAMISSVFLLWGLQKAIHGARLRGTHTYPHTNVCGKRDHRISLHSLVPSTALAASWFWAWTAPLYLDILGGRWVKGTETPRNYLYNFILLHNDFQILSIRINHITKHTRAGKWKILIPSIKANWIKDNHSFPFPQSSHFISSELLKG